MLRQMYICHHGEGAGFCGSGGKRESSQIGVTSWYVSTGGIIFYTKKNRFENSCILIYLHPKKSGVNYIGIEY